MKSFILLLAYIQLVFSAVIPDSVPAIDILEQLGLSKLPINVDQAALAISKVMGITNSIVIGVIKAQISQFDVDKNGEIDGPELGDVIAKLELSL